MQQQQVHMDTKLQHALVTKSQDVSGTVLLKLQEYQYENSQLGAHLSKITTDKNKEIAELTRKLG